MKWLLKISTSKKLSSWLIISGFVIFIIPYFQLLGIILLGLGFLINMRSDRTSKQKFSWSLPIFFHLLLVIYILLFTWMDEIISILFFPVSGSISFFICFHLYVSYAREVPVPCITNKNSILGCIKNLENLESSKVI